jgi:hypothetical protein
MGTKLYVEDAKLCYDGEILGPTDALFVDPHELTTLTEQQHGVIHLTLPGRIDLAFTAGTRVVTGEMKRPDDFYSSQRSKKLARQTNTIGDLGDIPALILRGFETFLSNHVYDPPFYDILWPELVRLQVLGVFILYVPSQAEALIQTLGSYRSFLDLSTRSAFASLHGDDRTSSIKGTLLNAVARLGPKRVSMLLAKFGNATGVARAMPEQWGLPKAARISLEKALYTGVDGKLTEPKEVE